MFMRFLPFALLLALVLASCSAAQPEVSDRAPPSRAALAMVDRACPGAAVKVVEACVDRMTASADERIRTMLCRSGKPDCAARFATFQKDRDRLVRGYMTITGGPSAVSRINLAIYALRFTQAFEQTLEDRPGH